MARPISLCCLSQMCGCFGWLQNALGMCKVLSFPFSSVGYLKVKLKRIFKLKLKPLNWALSIAI